MADKSSDCSGYLDRSILSVRNIFSSPDPQNDSPRKYKQLRQNKHDRSLNYSQTPVP